jgi:hypothetical protein
MTEPVVVEFFSIPRQRAGRAELAVPAGSVREVLAAVERACPALTDLVRPDGRLSPHYLFSLDGQRFLTDAGQALRPGERLWLLSADAGG